MPAPVWLDPRLASTLQHVLAGLPDDLQRAGWDEKLTGLLGQTAHPERALLNLATFTDRLSDPARFWHSATANSRILRVLMSLFAGSQHLSQVLLRHPERWPQLENNTALRHTRSLADYRAELDSLIAQYPERSALTTAMCAWQGWEMLRIGVGDLAGLTDLDTVVRQLSNLAESLVQACLQVCRQGPEPYPDGLTALGMGKLGGQELNYSSDIDLVFLAERHSQTLLRSVEGTIAMLSAVTPEGFMYRVDMRLRPWGKSGPLLPTRAGYLRYLARSARLWELQALLKARPIAGDLALGERFLADVRPLMAACDAMGIRDTVREMKERIEADLAERGKLWGEVKLGVGSIRDIEFVAQYLQLRHCDKLPMLLERNTLSALRQLHEHTILSEHDYRILSQGYTFLRPLEHYLQLMDYHQLHSVPQSAGELDQLARRLGFSGDTAGSVLLAHYQQHANAIRQVFDEQFYDKSSPSSADAEGLAPQVVRHLERLSPSYRETFTDAEIQHHAELIGRLRPDNLVEIEAVTLPSGQISLTVVGYDFPGELPVICGLIRAYEFNIEDGNIFTYEPLAEDQAVARFIGQVKKDPPDGLLIFVFKKYLCGLAERILSETKLPTVASVPLGTLLNQTILAWKKRSGAYLIDAERDDDHVGADVTGDDVDVGGAAPRATLREPGDPAGGIRTGDRGDGDHRRPGRAVVGHPEVAGDVDVDLRRRAGPRVRATGTERGAGPDPGVGEPGGRQGDEAAKEVVSQYIYYVSTGIINIINALQPDIICVGGGIGHEGEYLLEPLRKHVERERYSIYAAKQTQICSAVLGNDAGIIGAALLDD